MKVSILGEPSIAIDSRYRGTARFPPTYLERFPEHHPLNQLVLWYMEISNDAGVVADKVDFSRLYRLIADLNAVDERGRYELVELVAEGMPPSIGTVFLGVDLSLNGNGYSLLDGFGKTAGPAGKGRIETPASILSRLIMQHFFERLNAAVLFPNFELAHACLGAINAVQELAPNTFENGIYVPVAIWLVQGREVGTAPGSA